MKWLKKHMLTIILVIVLVAGLSLLLYPTFSDYWNSFHQSRAITSYAQEVAQIDDNAYGDMWNEAIAYNKELAQKKFNLLPSDEELEEYEKVLNIGSTGIMGYIEIPKINCSLPIYHGISDDVLQIAIGHLPGTSLPIGGESTHAVLSGHRGLPSARLFTDLDKLIEGDIFMIHTLDETLSYEVDKIIIVLPEEVDMLQIQEGEDRCTLITCTPYGINTHRLLVQSHRVETKIKNTVRVPADALQIEPNIVAPIMAIPILFILLIGLLIPKKRKR